MKKTLSTTANKVLLSILLLVIQYSAFAADGSAGEQTKWQIVSNMPEFWIGVALFFVFIGLFFISGRNKNKLAA